MLSDATQNGIHSFVVRKDIQRSKKWWRMRRNLILSFVARKDIPEGNNSAGCMMLSDATQNGIHSFVVRKDIQRSKKWWRMRRNLILSFVVRKDIPEGNNSARCNESHSIFCSQKRHPKLQNPVTESNKSHSLKYHRLFSNQKKVAGATKCHPLLCPQLVCCLNSELVN